MEESLSSTLGSGSWLGADEYEPGSPLHTRATNFMKTVKWDVLAEIESKHRGGTPCRYEDKFSIGHFNLVRRLNFNDGVSWVVRLRLPDEDMFAEREALTGLKAMEIEIASMKFFGSKTSIPVPKVMGYSTAPDNAAGAPYILMEYIHGSVASELRKIQATVASFRFPQIGSLYHDSDTDDFYIGLEFQTGRGPWTSSTEYYDDLARHLLKSASADDERKQSQSFMLPSVLSHLMRIHGEEKSGPFRLINRDFGAHNILMNDNFEIVGVIDFDGVMAAPLEVVAQYPTLSFLEVEPPGVVHTLPAAIARVKRTAPRLQEYKELLGRCESETGEEEGARVADRLGSTAASVYRGMEAYAQHQDSVNERWMKVCLKMVVDFAEGEQRPREAGG